MAETKKTEAFVFVSGAGEEAFKNADDLAQEEGSGVRYATRLTGPYDIFLAIEVEQGDLKAIEDLVLFRLRAPASTSTDTALVLQSPAGVKRSTASPYEAFIRVRVRKRADAEEVDRRLSQVRNYYASDRVQGTYHILLELAAAGLEELTASVADAADVEGVASIVPCYAQPQPR